MRWLPKWIAPASTQQRLANWYFSRFYQDIVELLEREAGLRPEDLVLEFGCDRGLLAHFLAGRCRLWLSDISDRRETTAALACEFHEARAEASDFKDQCADKIILVSVYHHLSGFERFTGEVGRLLKPGGKLILIEPIKRHPVTVFLYLLSKVVHQGDPNWTEPPTALKIDGPFIERMLLGPYQLTHKGHLDNALWGLNPFVPRPLLKGYFSLQRRLGWSNTEAYVFEHARSAVPMGADEARTTALHSDERA